MMAGSASETYFQSDSDFTQIRSSVFGIPGFLFGFSSKGSSYNDSIRSPTSHLDVRSLSKFESPFSFRSSRSSFDHVCKKKWDCSEVGLGIVTSLYSGRISDLTNGKTIIFRPWVKMINIPKSSRHYYLSHIFSERSNSLPKNYTVSSFSESPTYNPPLGEPNIIGNEGVSLGGGVFENILSCSSDSSRPTSPSNSFPHNPDSNNKSFCSDCKVTSIASSPLAITGGSHVGNAALKQPSVSITIDSSSLSAREIELSEDYTCIISHGANPKTTHIFGDCILDCDAHELSIFCKTGELGIQSTQVARRPERLALHSSNELLTSCYSCSTVLKEEKYVDIYRDGKLFCSSKCHSDSLLAEEEEAGETSDKSSECPRESSSLDLFLLGLQFAE